MGGEDEHTDCHGGGCVYDEARRSQFGRPGGGQCVMQLLAQLVQSLSNPGAAHQGDVKVQFTASEYAEYVAVCAARGKKDEAVKQKELVAAIEAAVGVALAAQLGRDRFTSRRPEEGEIQKTKSDCS